MLMSHTSRLPIPNVRNSSSLYALSYFGQTVIDGSKLACYQFLVLNLLNIALIANAVTLNGSTLFLAFWPIS